MAASPASASTALYAARPSIDQIAQGMSGIMSVTGHSAARVRSASASPSPTSWPGAFLAQGILIALLDREAFRAKAAGCRPR